MTFRKYLVLAGVVVLWIRRRFDASRGMKQVGSISPQHLSGAIFAVLDPWVAVGVLFLARLFCCLLTALSWADFTYVLPATSIGYVILALIAKFHCTSKSTSCVGWGFC